MEILIAGGHGQIALRLERLLSRAGHRPRGLIRNPAHAGDLEAAGAASAVCDRDHDDPRPYLGAADAIVYAAGAGPGSGTERKRTMDYGGAVKLIDAARELGVSRWLMVSSMGAGDPGSAPEAMRPYQQAKHDADEALAASGLDWTIVRPGGLTDEPGSGRVAIAERLDRRGSVPRLDVAEVLLECLTTPRTVHRTFELLEGDVPIREALAAL